MTRPNILFILSDQQRWDTVGAYGEPLGTELNLTPNLDTMAQQGVLFRNAFTCQPVCGPARACLQTGLYATANGCITNSFSLKPDAVTIADCMHNAGYETGYIGKWHLASNTHTSSDPSENFHTRAIPQERRGGYRDHWLAAELLEFTSHGYEGYLFDGDNRRVDFEGYRVDAMTNYVLDYLRSYATQKEDRPFFLFTSYIEPHHQNDLNRYVGPIGSKQRFAQYPIPGDLDGAEGDWKEHLPDYLGCCWSLDQNLGRIRTELELLGLSENTIVIYTSDHGSHFRTRNGEYKRSCHESSIHVPMIAYGPGFSGGKTIDELVSLIDLPPTVLTAGGATVPDLMQGRALQPLVDGTATDWPEEVFVQISESQTGRAIRTARWKYNVFAPDAEPRATGSDRYVEEFLYDLEADPHERHNLVHDPAHKGIRAELAARLKRRMAEVGESEPEIVAAESA